MTEVLLAVAIVGIISAIVLPMVVKNYQEKTLDAALKREKQTLESSIASLLINENTDDYKKTMLYTSVSAPSSYATTSGAYITKYLKVSKYCGDNSGDCFASKYYEYKDGDKKEYTPSYKGACASLKNGSSICIEPQTPSHGVRILLDINGKKSPNVKGRDLHEYELALPEKGALDRTSNAVNWDYKLIDIKPPCAEGETSEECCESNFNVGCCTLFPDKYGSLDACKKTCSATSGEPADCCFTSSEYEAAHQPTCCSIFTGEEFEKRRSKCCPGDSRCETPTTPETDKIVEVELLVTKSVSYGSCVSSTHKIINTTTYGILLHSPNYSDIESKGLLASFSYCPSLEYNLGCQSSLKSQSYSLKPPHINTPEKFMLENTYYCNGWENGSNYPTGGSIYSKIIIGTPNNEKWNEVDDPCANKAPCEETVRFRYNMTKRKVE